MSRDRPIRDVVVAGGGIAGWSAAAALKKRIPSLNVTIVDPAPPAGSLVDRVMCTLPSIGVFHEDVGLTDADTVWRAQGSLRAGTRFAGWSEEAADYVHAYGNCGTSINGVSFHQLWLSTAGLAEPFDRFSPAAELGRTGRICAGDDPALGAQEVGYGLHLTIDRYQQLMRAFALHVGVVERPAGIAHVILDSETGHIEHLELSNRTAVHADLFVDCTGPAAELRSAMDGDFIEWSRWLPCDRLIFATGPAQGEPDLLDDANAMSAGWAWKASSPAVASMGACFASAYVETDDVLGTFSSTGHSIDELQIRQGRWSKPWVRNCIALGDSAVTVEPLEWTNLHLAHNQIDRLISMMPGTECADVELAEYNRQCSAEADRVRDFVCMHYVTAQRSEPFWQEASRMELPDSLSHTLSLFAERGRLPYYEEETFTRDSWLAVLLGQGIRPRRIDPLATIFTPDEARRYVSDYGRSVSSFVEAQPSYRHYLSNLSDRASI